MDFFHMPLVEGRDGASWKTHLSGNGLRMTEPFVLRDYTKFICLDAPSMSSKREYSHHHGINDAGNAYLDYCVCF